MNRYSIILGKKVGLKIRLFLIIARIWTGLSQAFNSWLLNNKHNFSDYKWYRKWYGGSWVRWHTVATSPVWFPKSYKPGAVLGRLEEETWKEK